MQHTHNNHLQYGILNQGQSQSFYVRTGECGATPATPIEESIRAARLLASSTRLPIRLCLSGGVDSECMALAFVAAEVPFSATIMRFAESLNAFDVDPAIEFCKRMEISYEFFDLNVEEFFEKRLHLDYAVKYGCPSPQLAVHIQMLKAIDGFPVMAWNPLNVRRDSELKLCLGLPDEKYFSYHRFFEIESREGCAFFFLYTPELIYSFLRLPRMQRLIFDLARDTSYKEKCQIYRDGGFSVKDRVRKFSGFEKVKSGYSEKKGQYGPIFDRDFRQPMVELAGPERPIFRIISKKFLRVTTEKDLPEDRAEISV